MLEFVERICPAGGSTPNRPICSCSWSELISDRLLSASSCRPKNWRTWFRSCAPSSCRRPTRPHARLHEAHRPSIICAACDAPARYCSAAGRASAVVDGGWEAGARIILDPVPDCLDIPKGPSRHRAMIGAISHISHGGNRRLCRQQQTGTWLPRCWNSRTTVRIMERYHEGTYHCSRAGHSDLGPELRPTRRFRTALQQLFPGQPRLRQQRVLTIERLRSGACRVSD